MPPSFDTAREHLALKKTHRKLAREARNKALMLAIKVIDSGLALPEGETMPVVTIEAMKEALKEARETLGKKAWRQGSPRLKSAADIQRALTELEAEGES